MVCHSKSENKNNKLDKMAFSLKNKGFRQTHGQKKQFSPDEEALSLSPVHSAI